MRPHLIKEEVIVVSAVEVDHGVTVPSVWSAAKLFDEAVMLTTLRRANNGAIMSPEGLRALHN